MGRIFRSQKDRKVHVRDLEIRVGVENAIERFRADTYATKEPETLEWIDRYFRPGDIFYDVGANIGLYSLYAAKRLKGNCKVYAFEPEALNHARLSRNVHLNDLSAIVIPTALAVTDRVGFDIFYLNPWGFNLMAPGQGLVSGSALHRFGKPEDERGQPFQPFHQQGIVAASIDHLWKKWGLEFPNHIKIDVDGLEEKIIDGASNTLKDSRLRTILIEVFQSKGKESPIAQRLVDFGFLPVTNFPAHSKDALKGTPFEDHVNHVFVRSPS